MRGKKQTAKVSKASYLLKAYEKCNKSDMKMKRVTEPRRIVVGKSAMRNLKAFMKTTPLKDKPDNYSTPKRYYNQNLGGTGGVFQNLSMYYVVWHLTRRRT
jgi:hypothetical protein